MRGTSHKGFTLVEVMIVIAIMGIMAAMAMPNLRTYTAQRRLNGAARKVMVDLMSARQKAVTENNTVKVFFNSDGHSYTILSDQNGNGTIDTGEPTELKDIRPDYRDVSFSASGNPTFDPGGTSFGTKVTISSSMTGISQTYVKVASTGRVKIDDSP